MEKNNGITIAPSKDEVTPITDEDLNLIRASLEGQPTFANPEIPPPMPDSPLPVAPGATVADIGPRSIAPYPEPGLGATMAGTLSGLPFIGPLASKPMSDIAKKKQDMVTKDVAALEFFDKIMKENPRQAGQLVKSPMFRDALVRQHGAGDEDITNISKILSDPKMSVEEQTAVLGSRGMLNEKGSIVPQPFAIEKEKEIEREDYDKFEKAAKAANKDMTDFDAMMLWNTKGKRGAQPLGWGSVAVGGRAFIYDKDTGKTIPFEGFKTQQYASYPVLDENGFPQGIVIVAKEAPVGTDPKDVPYGYFDFRTEILKDTPPETAKKIVGDKDGALKRMNDWLIKNFGIGAELQNYAVSEEEVASGDVEMPNPKDVEYVGPAKRTPKSLPTAAELEASKYE